MGFILAKQLPSHKFIWSRHQTWQQGVTEW